MTPSTYKHSLMAHIGAVFSHKQSISISKEWGMWTNSNPLEMMEFRATRLPMPKRLFRRYVIHALIQLTNQINEKYSFCVYFLVREKKWCSQATDTYPSTTLKTIAQFRTSAKPLQKWWIIQPASFNATTDLEPQIQAIAVSMGLKIAGSMGVIPYTNLIATLRGN